VRVAIAWNDLEARAVLVDALVSDAYRLLGHLPEQELGPRPAEALALLALIAGQDVEPVEDSDGTEGRWRIARRVAEDRVISVVDLDARHAHKTVHRRTDGFKAHLVAEPDTGLITDCTLTRASGADTGDAAVGLALLASDRTIDEHIDVLADSAYGTGPMLAALAAAGHTALIKPWPTRSLIPDGFSAAEFVVDQTAGTLTCPAGHTVRLTPVKRAARFGDRCAGCALRARCTTSPRGRTVLIGEHDALQRAHRARASSEDFQAAYRRHRPMVERSIAWLTRGHRRVPYRGVAKNDAWLHLRTAAINLRRLINLGLTDTGGQWALAS
jgi:hypothetical protein